MNQDQAIKILIKGIKVAQSKGVYSLHDAKILAEAVEILTPKEKEDEKENTMS